ncbi:ABC-type branched-chain amino acid transport system, periplasmic component [Candidatus Terasakiella magnetica]|uniref:ABC-type branched-chain amino acid transport system, periplasmic component n=1 Tax=Candidatus Terasakiella magnetica TaxID=1867952 RepID=A0A1C3RFG2_9PROT|nr:ABC transporter substrate-binding protein [Candidatus Terasakiella magnetica]SCA56027.1 ABC-type branched-chain amino acid transport system, periplasmic component [Candidatus Terasakiella magnetica]
MSKPNFSLSRRNLLKGAGAVAGVAAASTLGSSVAFAAPKTIKIGYVTPKTGPLAPFAEADEFVIGQMRELFKGGLDINGTKHPIEIIVKDSQSSPNRAADVASELILNDEVNLMLVASTPETTNPVSDQCELNEVPCISTVAPWQPWFFTRGGKPETGFDWTYHFFWGLEDIISVFNDMWSSPTISHNKVVGGLWPNDGDGNAWGDGKIGFPPVLEKSGYKIVDPGRYQNLTDDFSAQISAYKKAGAEIVTGVPIPPDFTTFWTQAAQQGFKPKIVTAGKALLFPVGLEALGDKGHNLSCEVWWSPSHPFISTLTQQSAQNIADDFTKATGKQWTQPIGFAHALFEIATDVLKRTQDLDSNESVRDAVASTNLETLVGRVKWGGNGPFKNVAKTPLVGGQWRHQGNAKYELEIVSNKGAEMISTQGILEPIM